VLFNSRYNPHYQNVFATAHDDYKIRIWRLTKKMKSAMLGQLKGHTDLVHSIKWHPIYHNILVSGSFDGNIRLWNTTSKKCLYTIPAHDNDIYFVLWNKVYTSLLASAGKDGKVKIWYFPQLAEPIQKTKMIDKFYDISFNFKDTAIIKNFNKLSLKDNYLL